MSEQDKCPKCGAEFSYSTPVGGFNNIGRYNVYTCGTRCLQGRVIEEGKDCLSRQLDRAQAENERLKRYELECENASEELQKYRDGLPVGLLCITEAIKQLDVLALRQRAEKAEAACAAMTETFRAYRNVSGLLGRCCGEYEAMQAADRFRESLDHATNPGQPILDELRNFREFAQALLPSVKPVTPGLYDRACGEMYHELSKRNAEELRRVKAALDTAREVQQATDASLFNLSLYAQDEQHYALPMSGNAVTVRDVMRELRDQLAKANACGADFLSEVKLAFERGYREGEHSPDCKVDVSEAWQTFCCERGEVRGDEAQEILDELAKLREENATLKAERDAVYALAKGPAEQAKHIPLHQWVSTRFVHVEDHNDAINQLRASRDSAVAAEREKAEKAESTIQDMQCTYEFGSRVMNTLIIPNASNMLKDESALSALTRWLNCAIERAEQKGDEMVAMKQAHADDMERLASDMAISRGNAVLAERERCEQYITSSIEEHREAGELNLVDELVAIAAAIRQGGEGAK